VRKDINQYRLDSSLGRDELPEPELTPDERFTQSLVQVDLTKEGEIVAQSPLKLNHMPSVLREKMTGMLGVRLDVIEQKLEDVDNPKPHIDFARLLLEGGIGKVNAVTVSNKMFAKMVLEVVFHHFGEEGLEKCLPDIEKVMNQFRTLED
jgi:hypothetical protein